MKRIAFFTVCMVFGLIYTTFLSGVQGAQDIKVSVTDSSRTGKGSFSVASLIPENEVCRGWKRDGDTYGYGTGDLWEYIDGSAETYITYGFDTLLVQDYKSEEGKLLKVEVYIHRTPSDAFGIYSMYRNAELNFFDIGNGACGDDYSLHMWKGRFYVHLAVFEKSPALVKAMVEFARIIDSRIPDNRSLPEWVKGLPAEGMVEYSLSYVKGGLLGRGFYPPAFSAEYKLEGGGSVRTYISCVSDSAEASDITSRFVKSGFKILGREVVGGTADISGDSALGGYLLEDRYAGKIFTIRYGRWIVTIVGFGGGMDSVFPIVKGIVEGVAGQD